MSDDLMQYLFETNALRVSPKDKPFWYTSGMIGPFYINTHFLYGSEEKANRLLAVIDAALVEPENCPAVILRETTENYENDTIYREVIDTTAACVRSDRKLSACGAISGGERRDWFFSLQVARLLGKPHIMIFKDLSMSISGSDGFSGEEVLHISDLVNEASSYVKMWIPAIRGAGWKLDRSLTVVDRDQGGAAVLAAEKLKLCSMIKVNGEFFRDACHQGHISAEQLDMIEAYLADPHDSMRKFLLGHPEFLASSLAGDEKTAKRAKMCVDNDLYGLRGSTENP